MEEVSEKNLLRCKMYLYGYEDKDYLLPYNPFFDAIAKVLYKLPENSKIGNFYCTKKQINSLVSEFFKDKIKLHDIPYIHEGKFKSVVSNYLIDGITVEELTGVLEELDNIVEYIHPLELETRYSDGHSMVGEIAKHSLVVQNVDFLKKFKVYFSYIMLGRNISKLSACTKVHEIVHSQLEMNKGSVSNYLNKEVLTVFFEKLAALELHEDKSMLYKSEIMRYRNLFEYIVILKYNDFTYSEKVEASMFINSILLADVLFDIYINGDDVLKLEIMNDIQSIFDGNMVLEEMLSKYEVSINKVSIDGIKKKLERKVI